MKKWIKSYVVFTSLFYRLIMYILLPCGLIAAGIIWKRQLGGMIVAAVAALFTLAEVMADNWLFGGIHTKRGAKLEYLRTSGRGIKMLKQALEMDLARRLLAALLIFGVCCTAAGQSQMGIGFVLFLALSSCIFASLGIFVSRYGDMFWINMLAGYGAAVLELLCLSLPGLLEYVWIYDLVFALLGLICGGCIVKTAVKKVEGGYYGK